MFQTKSKDSKVFSNSKTIGLSNEQLCEENIPQEKVFAIQDSLKFLDTSIPLEDSGKTYHTLDNVTQKIIIVNSKPILNDVTPGHPPAYWRTIALRGKYPPGAHGSPHFSPYEYDQLSDDEPDVCANEAMHVPFNSPNVTLYNQLIEVKISNI
jgi:hypothetical protein